MRIIRKRNALPLVACDPGVGRDIGDRIAAFGKELSSGEPCVEHAIKPRRLLGIALNRVRKRLWGEAAKMLCLAEHRPEPADLKHQPLDRLRSLPGIG